MLVLLLWGREGGGGRGEWECQNSKIATSCPGFCSENPHDSVATENKSMGAGGKCQVHQTNMCTLWV